jgi:hypothetical protein
MTMKLDIAPMATRRFSVGGPCGACLSANAAPARAAGDRSAEPAASGWSATKHLSSRKCADVFIQ